jgi:Rnl2 family RNA ligase
MDLNDGTQVAFRRYPSFQNHYQERTIAWLQTKLAAQSVDRFIATEKLHGSNFAIYCNGSEIRCARRNGFLSPNENFHNGPTLAKALKSNILCAYTEIESNHGLENNEPFYVIFYGELYGGNVQQGISYGNDIAFRLFDISLEQSTTRKFVDYDMFRKICEDFELPTVPVMAEGTLQTLLALDAKFQSTILNKEGNDAEGYVLKYVKEEAFEPDESQRMMIKYKNPKFDEIAYVPKITTKGAATVDDDDASFLSGEFQARLTFMRLQAVKSKLNTKQAKNRQILSDEMYKDAVDDFKDESSKNRFHVEAVSAQAKKLTSTFVGNNIKLLSLTADQYIQMENYIGSIKKVDMAEINRMVDAGELSETYHIPQLRDVLIKRIKNDYPEFEGMKGALVGVINQKVMEYAKELVGMQS